MSVGGLAAYQFLAPQTNGDVDVAKSKVAALSTPSSDAEFAKGLAAFEAKNHEGAFEIWHPIAKDGHGRAQINIGQMYRTGQGVEKDKRQAQYWLGEAANAGLPRAQFALAETYGKTANPDDKNPVKAVEWYKRAVCGGAKLVHGSGGIVLSRAA